VTGKDEKPKREGAIKRFFRETVGELKRVSWPTRQEAVRLTVIVIVVMIVMGFFLWAIDRGATALLALAVGA